MDIGDFLELERTFERDRVRGAAPEIKDVAHFGELVTREQLDPRLERERLGQVPRHFDKRAHEPLLVAPGEHAARAARGNRKRRQRRKLAGESLGRGDADFRPGQGRHDDVALPGNRRGRHIDDGENVLAVLARITQRRQRIGGFARL